MLAKVAIPDVTNQPWIALLLTFTSYACPWVRWWFPFFCHITTSQRRLRILEPASFEQKIRCWDSLLPVGLFQYRLGHHSSPIDHLLDDLDRLIELHRVEQWSGARKAAFIGIRSVVQEIVG